MTKSENEKIRYWHNEDTRCSLRRSVDEVARWRYLATQMNKKFKLTLQHVETLQRVEVDQLTLQHGEDSWNAELFARIPSHTQSSTGDRIYHRHCHCQCHCHCHCHHHRHRCHRNNCHHFHRHHDEDDHNHDGHHRRQFNGKFGWTDFIEIAQARVLSPHHNRTRLNIMIIWR